jgi:hypothetical protein
MRYRPFMTHEEGAVNVTTTPEIRAEAARLVELLRGDSGREAPPAGGGSAGRGLAEEVRAAIVAVRGALFRRGVYDPVLVRFDSATVSPATNAEIATQLATIGESLKD